ncbi:non-ribosomal peptide synthetase [Sulfitobacter sp. JB4-11]|uniref:non-ribosomal peptide synthetase n=1 Tax=Sulfitobacter rhodophyticola TaxID=3238304 RepID=UPI003D819E91
MTQTFPLTPIQQGMYAGSALAARPWLYVEQVVVDLPGETLDLEAMQMAWAALARAHPVLRVQVVDDGGGEAVQTVTDVDKVVVTSTDLSTLSSDAAARSFDDFIAQDRENGIDVTRAPGFRVALFKMGEAHSKLVWTFPHTLLDGRSFAPLLAEVFDRYAAIREDRPQLNKDTAAPVFQQHCELLAQMTHAEGTRHFADVLEGWEGGEGLVRDGVEPGRKKYEERQLSAAETAAIKRIAQQCGVATSTVILLAWGVVTARLAGRDDTVFGNTLNGRNLVSGSGDAPGCFIVTVPMRLRLTRDLTLGTALKRLRASQIALRPFEQTPLASIRQHLDVPPTRQIFDTLVMFDRASLHAQMQACGGLWERRNVSLLEEGDAPVTLAVFCGEDTQLTVEYDPQQVPKGGALADHLMHFLRNLEAAHPGQHLGAISMLNGDEERRLRDLSGGPLPSDARQSCCATLFEAVVARQPDHPALEQPDTSPLSFAQLDRMANRRAHDLASAGIGRGDVIGICAARSPAFVIAQLAAWKLGAAFVPMDPSYPAETLNIIGEDSGAKLILTDGSAPELTVPTRDLTAPLPGTLPDTPPDRAPLEATHLAYIIFTSGSTGRPKGVMISHAALAAHSRAIIPLLGLTPDDRMLQFAALSFDVAIEEVMGTLLAGATLVLRTPEMSQSTDVFLDQVRALGITALNLPTGFWVVLTDALENPETDFPPDVRVLIVGGERVPLSVLRRWRAMVPQVRWLNGYGPTETTITSTAHEVTEADLSGGSVPIGVPLSHARGWIVAADGALAPEGAQGELSFSGPALAEGYVGLPERTEASFAPARFDPDIARLYASGDRAFWKNGLLHFIGRVDRQIKLRGFRIEPGQIEGVLEARPEVGRAHCALYAPEGGQPRLVAWYSSASKDEPLAPEQMRDWIAGALPPHMLPELIAITDWPQTPGGKVAVDDLPPPQSGPATPAEDIADASPLTQDVAALFESLLLTEGVGPETSFFDAGGDSLSLLRLLPQVEQQFGVRLKPTALYADPTPRGVVQALQEQDPDPLVVIPIQPEGTRAPLYGVHVLGDNGSFFRPLAAELGADQPVFGLTVGLLTEDTPTDVADIARFYLQQIERHHPTGPLSLIAVSAGSYVTFELAHQLLDWGRDVRAVIFLDAEGPGRRPRLGRLGRLGVHLGALRTHGFSYLGTMKAKRQEARSFAEAQARITDDTVLDETGGTGNIDEFVAANALAIEAYQPKPYPRRLTIFRAADDKFDSPLARQSGLGWKPVAAAGFDITDVPGDHLGLLQPPNVATLAAQVAYVLNSRNDDAD